MKQLTAILLIVVFVAVGVGMLAYVRMKKSGTAVSTSQVPTVTGKIEASGTTGETVGSTPQIAPSPLPTVSQIALTITAPANGSTVTTSSVTVKGKTVSKAEVFVNDKLLIADTLGNFSISVALDEGENTIVVTANDANGNYSEQDLTVTYNSGQ